ncbi:MAG: hypothetical protein O3C43_06905 [Verrucomicrobia bacterium]|nr:hypothetical protein [Verrucomicrobiota bacterium]MDA1066216.1 hypothetical protein [Verrucomicrobiota bacterium]
MLGRYKHLVALGIAGIVLGVPFLFRWISDSYEIYPSVLFPSGAQWYELKDGYYEFVYFEISGIDRETGSFKRLDPTTFIDPIPYHFLFDLVQNEFGLNPDHKSMDHLRYFQNRIRLKFATFTDSDRAETRQWLSERLLKAGCSNEEIRLRTIKARIKQYHNEMEDLKTINEKHISIRG